MRSSFRGTRALRVHRAVHTRVVPCGVTEAVYVVTEPVLRDSLLGASSGRLAIACGGGPENWVGAYNCWRRPSSPTLSPPIYPSPFPPTTPPLLPLSCPHSLFFLLSFLLPPTVATSRVGRTQMQYTRPGAVVLFFSFLFLLFHVAGTTILASVVPPCCCSSMLCEPRETSFSIHVMFHSSQSPVSIITVSI